METARTEELSPLEVVELEALLEPFCPVADRFGSYHSWDCLPECHICQDLLLKNGGTA